MGNDIRLFVGEAIDFTEKVCTLFCIEVFFPYLIVRYLHLSIIDDKSY